MPDILVYQKSDGKTISIPEVTPLPECFTTIAPLTGVDRWDGTGWTRDREEWLARCVRPERNARLDDADQRVRRYDYQVRAGTTPTESAEKIAAVLGYMQELRDLPETAQPEGFTWPEVPL